MLISDLCSPSAQAVPGASCVSDPWRLTVCASLAQSSLSLQALEPQGVYVATVEQEGEEERQLFEALVAGMAQRQSALVGGTMS